MLGVSLENSTAAMWKQDISLEIHCTITVQDKNRKLQSIYLPVKDMIKIRFPLRDKLAHYAIFMYQRKKWMTKKTLFTYCSLFTWYLQINKIDMDPEYINANRMFVFIHWTLFFVNLLITYYFNNEIQVKTSPKWANSFPTYYANRSKLYFPFLIKPLPVPQSGKLLISSCYVIFGTILSRTILVAIIKTSKINI